MQLFEPRTGVMNNWLCSLGELGRPESEWKLSECTAGNPSTERCQRGLDGSSMKAE